MAEPVVFESLPSYAAAEDFLGPWGDREVPPNVDGLLLAASGLVADAIRVAAYPVRPDGTPHPAVAAVLRDATDMQAVFWAVNDLDPEAGPLGAGSGKVVASKSIQGASVSYDSGAAAADRAARQRALTSLCPAAWAILQRAGLAGSGAVAYGW